MEINERLLEKVQHLIDSKEIILHEEICDDLVYALDTGCIFNEKVQVMSGHIFAHDDEDDLCIITDMDKLEWGFFDPAYVFNNELDAQNALKKMEFLGVHNIL